MSFESLTLRLSHSNLKLEKTVRLVTGNRPTGPYSKLLTHCFNHILDLVLTYGIEMDKETFLSQNPRLSHHNLVTFKVTLNDCTASKE